MQLFAALPDNHSPQQRIKYPGCRKTYHFTTARIFKPFYFSRKSFPPPGASSTLYLLPLASNQR